MRVPAFPVNTVTALRRGMRDEAMEKNKTADRH